ncbi:tetratricopeptide repeat protein [Nocardia caishijiensis]|uniref:tetratricopeptide repeat protein n=1 Tax=Nocardia caishijiensis TaxID=184756 RepID=UPI0009FEFE54
MGNAPASGTDSRDSEDATLGNPSAGDNASDRADAGSDRDSTRENESSARVDDRSDRGHVDSDRDENASSRGDDRARGGDRAVRDEERSARGFRSDRDGDRAPRGDDRSGWGADRRDDRGGSGYRGADDSRFDNDDRRRGGEGARAAGGRPTDRRAARPDEPDIPEDVQASDLDPAVRRDLLSLDKSNAETVARHMVMAVELLEDDPRLALAHARAARQRAGRIAVVRETAGVVAYHAGEWAEALSELRTARRMSGGSGLLAVMADCERGLGRPERAIELGRSEEAQALTGDEATELRIVVAGARMDLGQFDQAVVTLQASDLNPARTGSAAARLFYAYADALVAAGRTDEGLQWFLNAAAADEDGETDAEERASELTGGDAQ